MTNKILSIVIILVLFSSWAMAANIDFDKYNEKVIFKGKPASPDIASKKEARRYRTLIKAQAKEGPNFAGQYTIIQIGCGSSCVNIAVVNAKTGQVYFPDGLHMVIWGGWWHEPYGPEFKLSSRLLVVYGQVNSDDAPYGISYFEWKENNFKLIHFEQRDRGRPPK